MQNRVQTPVERRLEPLRQQVLRMGHLAEAILEKSLTSVWERNPEMASEVAADDLPIDRLDVELDRAIIEFLALQAPVAQDLREVIAIKSAATDLERVGDIARNIAKSAIRLSERSRVATPASLEALASSSNQALKNAMRSFADYDSVVAREVLACDDEVDADEERVFDRVISDLRSQPQHCEQLVDFILIGKNLERVGDHATNIAEDVVMAVESLNLKHTEKLNS